MNQRTNIEWTPYLATAYAEGFGEGEDATAEENIEAWAYIIETGLWTELQGFFGRTCAQLVSDGLISKQGVIDWEVFDERRLEDE